MSITRTELLKLLAELNCNITERQLRYLEQKGVITRLGKDGNEVLYPYSAINNVLVAYKLRTVSVILKKHGDQLTKILLSDKEKKYVEAICRKNEIPDRS